MLPNKQWENWPIVPTSAHTDSGIDDLIHLVGKQLNQDVGDETIVITDARQHAAIRESLGPLVRASNILNTGSEPELAAATL